MTAHFPGLLHALHVTQNIHTRAKSIRSLYIFTIYKVFNIKPQFFKTLFQSQFLFDFNEIFTNRSENVRSFL